MPKQSLSCCRTRASIGYLMPRLLRFKAHLVRASRFVYTLPRSSAVWTRRTFLSLSDVFQTLKAVG